MTQKVKANQFESSLKALNSIVEKMEQGDLSLEESLKQFEQGIKLVNSCQKTLSAAEQKVKILLEKNNQATLEAYDPTQDD